MLCAFFTSCPFPYLLAAPLRPSHRMASVVPATPNPNAGCAAKPLRCVARG